MIYRAFGHTDLACPFAVLVGDKGTVDGPAVSSFTLGVVYQETFLWGFVRIAALDTDRN